MIARTFKSIAVFKCWKVPCRDDPILGSCHPEVLRGILLLPQSMLDASEYLGMTNSDMMHLPPHNIAVAVLQPQIAPNTGNIARLCVATGAQLHLVRPLGFVLSNKQLRRSAMDYWPR